VDAVGAEVTADQESCPAGDEPGSGWQPDFAGLEFLPLLCPDCTFALDLEPRHEVCRCPNCHRALEVSGGRLSPVEETAPRSTGAPGERRLPFWVYSGVMSLPGNPAVGSVAELRKLVYGGGTGEAPSATGESLNVWVPAFECRQADKLLELSARFTLFESPWEAGTEVPVGGCLLSQAGARPMVELCLLRALAVAPLIQASFEKQGRFEPTSARLAWIAFQPVGPEMQEARTGAVLTESLLEPWL
jgi:hypothetical protein